MRLLLLLLTTICSCSFAFTRNNAVRTCPLPRRLQCGAVGETGEFPDWSSFLQTESEQEREGLIGAFSESFEELWPEPEWSGSGKKAKAARLMVSVLEKTSVATWEVLSLNISLQALEILESEIPEWYQDVPELIRGDVANGFENQYGVLQRFVASIFQGEEEIADSNGMSVWRDIPSLEVGSAVVRDVVIRNITRPLWASVLDVVDVEDKQYRVVVRGTPGTGKTTTTAVLIRMLLKRKKKVIYHIRSRSFIFEMTPSFDGRQIELSVHDFYASPNIIRVAPSLENRNAYYVVDPGNVKENCNPSQDVVAKVIIVSSPNSENWGRGNFDKLIDDTNGLFYHHPLWTLEELQVARNYIRPELNISEVDLFDRFRQVGGVPRNIFCSPTEYQKCLRDQRAALTQVDRFQAVNIAQGKADAIKEPGDKQLKSAILGYNLKESDNFAEEEIVVISPSVTEQIVNKHKSAVWGEMRALAEKGWWLFEAISRSVMTESRREFECRPCVGKSDKRYDDILKVTLGGCTSGFRLVVDPVASAKARENVVFHSLNTKYQLIDFVYRDATGYHAFQVTIGKTHSANVTGLQALSERFADEDKVTLYYVVPSYNFVGFTTSPVQPVLPPESKNITILHLMVPDPTQDVRFGSNPTDDAF